MPCGDEMDKIVPLYEGGIAWIIWTDIVQQFVKSSVLVGMYPSFYDSACYAPYCGVMWDTS